MAGYKHFSHPHILSFHQSLEDAQITCTGCNFPCTNTFVYSCRACKFFLHDQCFDATRSLIHPSHPDHPLVLFPSPTYTSGSFTCKSCNETGSGFCFGCPTCEFDLHIHCAYDNLNQKSSPDPTPNQIKLKSHLNHPLKYIHKQTYTSAGSCLCDVCGTACDPNGALYRCDICDYDTHVECACLPETIRREDHEHALSLFYLNPYPEYICDVCMGEIGQRNCMYLCTSGCDYGTHVRCVFDKVSQQALMDEMTFNFDMSKFLNKMRELIRSYWTLAIMIVVIAILIATIPTHNYYANRHYQYSSYCDNNHCIIHSRVHNRR